jgi:hypothetical protein
MKNCKISYCVGNAVFYCNVLVLNAASTELHRITPKNIHKTRDIYHFFIFFRNYYLKEYLLINKNSVMWFVNGKSNGKNCQKIIQWRWLENIGFHFTHFALKVRSRKRGRGARCLCQGVLAQCRVAHRYRPGVPFRLNSVWRVWRLPAGMALKGKIWQVE